MGPGVGKPDPYAFRNEPWRKTGTLSSVTKGKSREPEFWERLRQLGGRPAEGATYSSRVAVVCAHGHASHVQPSRVLNGKGLCDTCRKAAETKRGADRFWVAIAAAGLRPQPAGSPMCEYVNTDTQVAVLCPAGHVWKVLPHRLIKGQIRGAGCPACTAEKQRARESEFWRLVGEKGGRPTETSRYVTTTTPVDLICSNGHKTSVWPKHILSGQGFCGECNEQRVAQQRAAGEERFNKLLTEAGGRRAVVADLLTAPCNSQMGEHSLEYVNNRTPVWIVCAQGHVGPLKPADLSAGRTPCHECAGYFNRVYLLKHDVAGAIKIGITGHDARIREHRQRGYQTVGVWASQTHQAAMDIERAVIAGWRERGLGPVQATPKDGRTETVRIQELVATVETLDAQLERWNQSWEETLSA